MDFVHSGRRQPKQQCNKATLIVEEDRLSNLPNDIIHRILSFLDMKYVVQTSTLSKKWKLIWNSMPHLNFNRQTFHSLPQFAKFVEHVISHRNNHTEVSQVKLALTRGASYVAGKSIVEYAYSHNVRKLNATMLWSKSRFNEFPKYLFNCHTLKHLTLSVDNSNKYLYVPQSAWEFRALETLSLRKAQFGDVIKSKSLDLFSKCVNLKDLISDDFDMFNVETFDVRAPQLLNLTITNPSSFPKVLNVVAPQLQNLTAPLNAKYSDYMLELSTEEGFDSLEKVNLSLPIHPYNAEKHVPVLLDLFQKLCSAKFLILDVGIIKAVSLCMDQVSHEPSPFHNLKCLQIDTESLKPYDLNIDKVMTLNQNEHIATIATEVRNYLLHSSPTATFIMDLHLPHQWHRRRDQCSR